MKTSRRFLAVLLASAALSAYGADAATNWSDLCAKCHGADGKGDTKMGKKLGVKDFTDANVQGGFTDDEVFKAIKEGVQEDSGKTKMKAGEGLSDDDIHAMVQHIRGLKK